MGTGVRRTTPAAVLVAALAVVLVAMPHQAGSHADLTQAGVRGDAATSMVDAVAVPSDDMPMPLAVPLALGCAVMLVALLAVRALGARRQRPPRSLARVSLSPAGTRPAGRGPPRPVLAELCVLRT